MKISAPFIGFPSPAFGWWHLFARKGADHLEHVASIIDKAEVMPIHENLSAPYRYQVADVERWSEGWSRL